MSIVKLRPIQEKVIKRIEEAIEAGKTDIFIEAPTGTGKGIIGLEISKFFSSYILTSEKSLQQQYEEDTFRFNDYSPVKSICGVDTYKCNVNNEKFSLGVCKSLGLGNQEALKLPCASNCEYLQRWKKAKESERTVMNYSYYLIQMNYVLNNFEDKAPFQKRDLVICDEAHKLPDIIEGHFACTIDLKIIDQITRCLTMLVGARMIKSNTVKTQGLFDQIIKIVGLSVKADPQKHLDSLRELVIEYQMILAYFNDLKEELAKKFLTKSGSVEDLKRKASKLPKEAKLALSLADNLKDRHCKIQDYVRNIEDHGLVNLIVDEDAPRSRTYHNLDDSSLFKNHFAKFSQARIYLSASLQPELLIKRWNLDPAKTLVLSTDSQWDTKKSKVVLCNTANMSYNSADESMRKIIRKINELLDKHKGERGLIHTTSNALTEEVCSNVHNRFRDRLVRYVSTKEKMEILAAWDKYPQDAVLVGPSLTTGIDMKDDFARFNIVVKLSYPNMRSALWARRSESLQHIYLGETASVLEQACGRTTRSIEDWSISYILDSRAERFMLQNQLYFSQSFLKRVRLEK
jgi:ATP-dependent DNA helicase DinG